MSEAKFCPQCGSDDVEGDTDIGYVCFDCRARFARPDSGDVVQVRHSGSVDVGSSVFVCQDCGSKSPRLSVTEYKCSKCTKTVCPACAGKAGVTGVCEELFQGGKPLCRTCRKQRDTHQAIVAFLMIGGFIVLGLLIIAK